MTYLYAIGAVNGPIKIGFSDNPKGRIPYIANASPIKIEFARCFDVGCMHKTVESTVHAVLRTSRANGEWFHITSEEAISAIQKTAELLSVSLQEQKIDSSASDEGKNPRGRPKKAGALEQITLRIDPAVLAHYRATGKGWQSKINADLRKLCGL